MRIALDPYMFRSLPLPVVIRLAADVGYDHIELSPRPDFLPFYVHPRASRESIDELNSVLQQTGVTVAAVLIGDYKWASDDESERTASIRYWKVAIDVATQIGCSVLAAEFGGRPEARQKCEAAFWRSLDDLLPVIEANGIVLTLEPHPYNFVEDNQTGVDMVRAIGSNHVRYLYCAPHTFHLGDDIATMIGYAGSVLAHVHVADTMNHRGSSGIRFIVNPAGSNVRVHQHLNISEGEVEWDSLFGALSDVGFDGLLTNSVFGREESARESAAFMLKAIQEYAGRHGLGGRS